MLTHSKLPVRLLSGNAHPALARSLGAELGILVDTAEVTSFADGETRVHVSQDVRDTSVFIVQPTCPPVNDNLIVLALLVDAVRAAGATRVTAIIPYFGYARQEQRSCEGDPRSAQVVSRLLGSAGIDQLVTLDLHAPALESALPMPAILLQSDEVFLPWIEKWSLPNLVVISPDAGGMKRAQRYARALQSPLATIAKQRMHPDAAKTLQVLGDVHERNCLIVDDMASTGNTLCSAAKALRLAGARDIYVVITHAVMAPGAMQRLSDAHFTRMLTSDSIPLNGNLGWEVVPIAPLLAKTIRELTHKTFAVHS